MVKAEPSFTLAANNSMTEDVLSVPTEAVMVFCVLVWSFTKALVATTVAPAFIAAPLPANTNEGAVTFVLETVT
jgi:uncharacterized membrane protein (DUF485 family)